MTVATEQQTRPLIAHLEAAGYRHQPGAGTDAWELGESCRIRVISWPGLVYVRGYDEQMRPLWKRKFPEGTPDEEIVTFLSTEEKGLGRG